jgi:hypothetical protein
MSKTPKYDAKVKEILDSLKPGERTCEITGEKWNMGQTEIDWYRKFNVPPSNLEHTTRWAYRSAFWMGMQIWNNKDYRDGKTLLSLVHPATKWKVMPDQDWFQNDYSELNIDCDANRPLFDSIEELAWQVPIHAYRHFDKPINSISLCSLGDEDGHFVIATSGKRNFYSSDAMELEDVMEVFVSGNIDRSFNVVHSYRIADSKAVRESRDCMSCCFVFDCRNCEKCFGAWNKRNKKYLWWNEQLTEEEWDKRYAEVDLGNRNVYKENFDRFQKVIDQEAVWPENFNVNSETCVGDYLNDCVDCYRCNFAERARDCSYGVFLNDCQNMYHSDGPQCSDSYMASPIVKCRGMKFCWSMAECIDCEYCINCFNCEDCFGCVGLNRKKFHIFNREYSEDEYWQKVDQVKCAMLDRGEYGKYFPLKLVQSYVPDSGIRWMFGMDVSRFDYPDFKPDDAGAFGPLAERLDEARDAAEIPADVDQVDSSWVGTPLVDKERGRPFSLIQREIDYCQRFRIPISTKHPVSRWWQGGNEMNKGFQVEKICSGCQSKLSIAENLSYPNRKIYCHDCYLKHLENYG